MGLFDGFPFGRKSPTPPPYWAAMYDEAVWKVERASIPRGDLHCASVIRGFFTGLVMGMTHPHDRKTLFAWCVSDLKPCRMIHQEFEQVFADMDQREQFDEEIEDDSGFMNFLTEAGTHDAILNLRRLYSTMPHEALKLGVAFGMLFALRLWGDHPDFAQELVDLEQAKDAPEGRGADHDEQMAAFDALAAIAFPLFYNESRPAEDRVKDAICGGLIFGLKDIPRSNMPGVLLDAAASQDSHFAANVADTAALAAVLIRSPKFLELLGLKAPSHAAVQGLATALCQLMLESKNLQNREIKSAAYEGLCRGLVFALVLWRDHPRVAEQLAKGLELS